eukprot:CAMPEP_0183609840 /NCGR_PEP_ID=MMETSP0371-20130417/184662_1 /TAXON_ID=268820 /ORGANISM="Peridinium aciculiferum, Strain PAER-2" /LENGTH=138 /DNA_ID=CAMNT_0025821967 /DNA_START=378 /DNA_END=791 /DNA_ORIENTATION=-
MSSASARPPMNKPHGVSIASSEESTPEVLFRSVRRAAETSANHSSSICESLRDVASRSGLLERRGLESSEGSTDPPGSEASHEASTPSAEASAECSQLGRSEGSSHPPGREASHETSEARTKFTWLRKSEANAETPGS